MIQHVDKTNETKVDDSLDMTRPSRVNIHSVVIVIMLALVATFLMVVGVNYFYSTKHLKGQSSSKYFCPSSSSAQVGICVKS